MKGSLNHMILVTGATGKTGNAVAQELAAHKIPFRVLVRNAEKGAPFKDLGAEVAVGDMADKAAVNEALKGVSKAVLIMANGEQQLDGAAQCCGYGCADQCGFS